MSLAAEYINPALGELTAGHPIAPSQCCPPHLSVGMGERTLSWTVLPTDSDSESTDEDERNLKEKFGK